MFGFVVGTLCLVAFIVVYKRGSRRHFGRSTRRWLFRRLDTSLEQEKIIRNAFLTVKETAKSAVQNQAATRRELADLLRAESYDDMRVSAWFEAREYELGRVREAAVQALGEVYEVLDDQQRETLARLVERGSYCSGIEHAGAPYRQPPEAL